MTWRRVGSVFVLHLVRAFRYFWYLPASGADSETTLFLLPRFLLEIWKVSSESELIVVFWPNRLRIVDWDCHKRFLSLFLFCFQLYCIYRIFCVAEWKSVCTQNFSSSPHAFIPKTNLLGSIPLPALFMTVVSVSWNKQVSTENFNGETSWSAVILDTEEMGYQYKTIVGFKQEIGSC